MLKPLFGWAAAFLIMLTSLSGVLFTHRFARRALETNLSYLVSFSAGVFLVTAVALGLEAIEVFGSTGKAALAILAGYLLAWGMHHLLPETHHHHDHTCHRTHGGARKLLVGDAIHNVADGIILVPAFLAGPVVGIGATVAIVLHETLQEISEFIVLRQSGYSTKRALAINFAVSSTILIGVGVGYAALATAGLEALLLALAAGFFGHVVVHDLLPRRKPKDAGESFLPHLLLVAAGAVTMATITAYLGETHLHGEGEHDHGEIDDHAHEHE